MASTILQSALVVSTMTLMSRISGLIRDIALANYLGSSAAADAFFMAFRIPNLFRRIFGEGAFSLAFVPVFSEFYNSKTRAQTQFFVNRMAAQLGLAVLVVCVIGVSFSEYFILVIAPGYADDPVKFTMTAQALRIMFPYLFFISMVAMAAGILNCCERFAVPAVTPVILNICLIIGAVIFLPQSPHPTIVLAIAVFIAGVVQFLFQIPFLKRQAILPLPSLAKVHDKENDGVRQVFKLMMPVIYGSSVAQINTIVNSVLASFLVTGSVSWLYYSDRLMEFPLALFVMAVSTVILPNLSKQYAAGNELEYSLLLDWAMRVVLLIVIPSVVGLFVLSEHLMVSLFQYNKFSPHDALMSSYSLKAYSFGLLGLGLTKVLAPGFYARQDTTTPVKIGVVAMLVNLLFAVILVSPFHHVGLAIAFSISAWVNALLLAWHLIKKGLYKPSSGWLSYTFRLLIAAAIMGVIVYYGAGDIDSWIAYSLFERLTNLSLWIAIGMTSFVILSYATGLRVKQLVKYKSV